MTVMVTVEVIISIVRMVPSVVWIVASAVISVRILPINAYGYACRRWRPNDATTTRRQYNHKPNEAQKRFHNQILLSQYRPADRDPRWGKTPTAVI
jgi:hypothetical protein